MNREKHSGSSPLASRDALNKIMQIVIKIPLSRTEKLREGMPVRPGL